MLLLLFTRLTNLHTLFSKGIEQNWQRVGNLPDDLMKDGPEDAKRTPLKLIAIAVEEERKDKVVVCSFVSIESIS